VGGVIPVVIDSVLAHLDPVMVAAKVEHRGVPVGEVNPDPVVLPKEIAGRQYLDVVPVDLSRFDRRGIGMAVKRPARA
jgi:hypothetical protein